MKILVCGCRDFHCEWQIIDTVLEGYYSIWVRQWHARNQDEMFYIISGMAPGADSAAVVWATKLERVDGARVVLEPFPAKWEVYGRAAGPKRNQEMLDKGKPDLVLAFVHKPLSETKGTKDMVTRSRKAGVRTVVHEVLPVR